MVRKGLRYGLAYLLWIVTLGLGLWFIYVSWNAVRTVLGYFILGNPFPGVWQAQLFTDVYIVILGILWLLMFVWGEEYFRSSVEKQNTWRRFSRIAAPEVLLIFAADLSIVLVRGIANVTWLHWLILVVEAGAGVFLLLRR